MVRQIKRVSAHRPSARSQPRRPGFPVRCVTQTSNPPTSALSCSRADNYYMPSDPFCFRTSSNLNGCHPAPRTRKEDQMPSVGEQADILRALGRMFDEERANEIEITIHEAFLAVSWMKLGYTPQQR